MDDNSSFAEGMRAYHGGDYAAAARVLRQLTEREGVPGRMARYYCAMAHKTMGMELLSAGSYAEAAAQLHQAVALIGRRADLADWLLAAYAGAGQYDRCAAEADVLSQARPTDAAPRVTMAHAQWRSARREDAVMTLTRALRELGDRAELHLNLGLFYAAEQKLDLARQHIESAVQCDCSSVAAHRYLGLTAAAAGDFPRAAGAFQRALALDGDDLMLMYDLCLAAGAAAAEGEKVTVNIPERARPASSSQVCRLAEYAAADPDFIKAFLALPVTEADEELCGVLLSVLQTALGRHDNYADLHYLAGQALSRLGDDAAARRHLQRAVKVNPKYVDALTALAELEVRGGATAPAVAHLQRAVAAGADYPDLHARLGDLLKKLNMHSLAKEHYQRALQLNAAYRRAAEGLESLAA